MKKFEVQKLKYVEIGDRTYGCEVCDGDFRKDIWVSILSILLQKYRYHIDTNFRRYFPSLEWDLDYYCLCNTWRSTRCDWWTSARTRGKTFYRHLVRYSARYYTRGIRLVKIVCTLDAKELDWRIPKSGNGGGPWTVCAVPSWKRSFTQQNYNWWWMLDSCVHAWNERTIKIMASSGISATEKFKKGYAGKVFTTVFWNTEGVLIEFWPTEFLKRHTMLKTS